MEAIGVNFSLLLLQCLTLLPLILWIALSLLALLSLRQRVLSQTAQAIWVLLILIVPVLGAAAFWIVRPGDDSE